jgi:sarcosine oxidase
MVSPDPTTRFRVAVVGKGMIGSAAVRHLSRQSDGAALIGPDEPAVRAEHHDVFGSHYDERRIYRILDMLDGDLIWGRLAVRSAPRQGPTRVLKPLVRRALPRAPRRRVAP